MKKTLKKWIPVVNEIYENGPPNNFLTCPYCKKRGVKFTIQTYEEEDATIFLECLNCKIFDHISRMPIPDWIRLEN